MGSDFSRAPASADSVFTPHELLRSGLLPGGRLKATGGGVMRRQPAERRCRASRAEHERHVRMERGRRFAVKIVVKIGGAALEESATLRKCCRSVVQLAQDGHRVVVVHG